MNRALLLGLSLLLAIPACAQLDALFATANQRLEQGDYKGAVAPLSEGLALARGRGVPLHIANFAHKLAICHDSLGESEKALPLYEESLGIYERAGLKSDAAGMLTNLGLLWSSRGSAKKALELELRALSLAQEGGDKSTLGRVYGNLGVVYGTTSDHKKALEFHAKALEIHTVLDDKYSLGLDLQNMAAENLELGNYDQSLELLGRAKTLTDAEPDPSSKAGVLLGYANIYNARGDYAKAMQADEAALALARQGGDKRLEIGILGDMGAVHEGLLDFPRALELYDSAQRLAESISEAVMAARQVNSKGIVALKMGQHRRAAELFDKALALQIASGDRSGQCYAHNNHATNFVKLGDYARARESYEKALALCGEIHDKRGQATLLANLGELTLHTGEYAQGRAPLERSIVLLKEMQLDTKNSEMMLAGLDMAEGKTAQACAAFERIGDALGKAECKLLSGDAAGAEPLFAKLAMENKGKRLAEEALAAGIGLCLTLEKLRKGEPARQACEEAVAAVERQRELLPPSARGHFLAAEVLGLPRLQAYTTRALARSSAADGFLWSESVKARAFLEALAARSETARSVLPAEWERKEAAASAKVAGLYSQMDQAFHAKNEPLLRELEPRLAAAKKEQEAFVTELRRSHPQYAAVQYPLPVRPEELALRAEEVLLEFLVTESRTLAFVVDGKKAVTAYEVPLSQKALGELVTAFRKPFEQPAGPDGKFAGKLDAVAGAKLYAALLKPALAPNPKTGKALVPKGAQLIVVPDSVLGLLPFEALITGPKRYVADDYDVAYAQSGSALTLARTLNKGESAAAGMLVVADPVFDKGDPRLKGSGLEGTVALDGRMQDAVLKHMGVGGARQASSFERLEETGVLAESLKTSFGGGVVTLTGREAGKPKLLAEDLSRYRYLVLATHGILDSEVPYIREPALVLTQVGRAAGDDGFLGMSEVLGLTLKAEVVALTACKTGLGKEVGGEGVMGLGRAFQYAGAKSVLVSLWSVSEKSTTHLTKAFFESLKAGKSPREALKAARASTRKAGFDHPFFWAPFILVGS